jgi:TRAP-type mannitol/chloroaromatic compound transport system permease small subunit
MIRLTRVRLALMGSCLWLIPTLSLAIWYGGSAQPIVPVSWVLNALCLLAAGLGTWVLLLVILYRGAFPYVGALLGVSWIVLTVAMDMVLHLSSGFPDWGAYVAANGPADGVVFLLCVGAGRLVRRAQT